MVYLVKLENMLMSINMVEMNAIHVFPNIQTVNLAAQTHARS